MKTSEAKTTETVDDRTDRVLTFKADVARWAERINVTPRRVQVQLMTRKWASCSTAGTVTFSFDLLDEPASFREYVIVHELLHLLVPNHGKVFRALLRSYIGVRAKHSGQTKSCGFQRGTS